MKALLPFILLVLVGTTALVHGREPDYTPYAHFTVGTIGSTAVLAVAGKEYRNQSIPLAVLGTIGIMAWKESGDEHFDKRDFWFGCAGVVCPVILAWRF